ncbi:MAG: hypothetical protein PHF69_03445 [Candidatus Omnitrophica bacterium]|nr:hypothetical protein [Candidatus Omnitrophota bacterium]
MKGFAMRIERKKAQSILEYVILFGVLTAMVGVTLIAASSGGGQLQSALKSYIDGS